MDATVARKMYRALEPYHAMIYFVPEATQAYKQLGLKGRMAGYFASRAAAMGPISAEIVISTFFNFNPQLVRSAIPGAWQVAMPEQFIAARLGAVDAALRRMLGENIESPEVAEAASIAREATTACISEGRVIYAAHAALPWPAEPHMVLWQAVTLLREFRFGGHVAALLTDEVDGIEALIMHAATGEASRQSLQSTRGWSDEEWEAASQQLRERGWLTSDNTLTEEGQSHRNAVEQLTDQLALAPWRHIGDASCERLRDLGRPLSKTIVDAKTFATF